MSELSPDARQLFRVARDAFTPDAAQVGALRAALRLRMAVAPGAPGASVELGGATGSALSGGGGKLLAGLSAKQLISIGLLVTGAASGAYLAGTRDAPAARCAPSMSACPAAAAPTPPSTPSATSAPALPAPPAALSPAPLSPRGTTPALRGGAAPVKAAKAGGLPRLRPTAAAPRAHARSAPANAAARSDQPEPLPADALSREVALLRAARSALAQNDAERALALLARHAAQFPHATLEQERMATRVLALCALARVPEARAEAQRLERLAPHSLHLASVRHSCVTNAAPPRSAGAVPPSERVAPVEALHE